MAPSPGSLRNDAAARERRAPAARVRAILRANSNDDAARKAAVAATDLDAIEASSCASTRRLWARSARPPTGSSRALDCTIVPQVSILTRAQVIARLRRHAADHGGFVTTELLVKHDWRAHRSMLAHFDSLAAAREAAGLPARRPPKWTQARVVRELRRLDRLGVSTKVRDLTAAGHSELAHAAFKYAGGLRRARTLAGIAAPRAVRGERWDKLRVLATLIELRRNRRSVARSRVPPQLVSAGIRHFGSWSAAIGAIPVLAPRPPARKAAYTKAEILGLLRELKRAQPGATWAQLHEHHAAPAMQRLFGSVKRAVAAARFKRWPTLGDQTWSRARIIAELQAGERQGTPTVTRKLEQACVAYFGSVSAARAAAGVRQLLRAPWTKQELVKELQKRARRGDFGADLRSAARRLFGSIANARKVAGVAGPEGVWTRQLVIAELRGFVRSGQRLLPDRLKGACRDYFGSVPAACRAARVSWPFRRWMESWNRPQILAELRRRVTEGGDMTTLAKLCRDQFGSVQAARRAAGLPYRRVADTTKLRAQQAAADDRYPWRRWSRDVVVRMVRAWSEVGGPMSRELQLACERRFGRVSRACTAAKVEMAPQPWTAQGVQAALREAAQAGGPLPLTLRSACARIFGSVAAARVAAGVPPVRRARGG
jgi:hypothetical protein